MKRKVNIDPEESPEHYFKRVWKHKVIIAKKIKEGAPFDEKDREYLKIPLDRVICSIEAMKDNEGHIIDKRFCIYCGNPDIELAYECKRCFIEIKTNIFGDKEKAEQLYNQRVKRLRESEKAFAEKFKNLVNKKKVNDKVRIDNQEYQSVDLGVDDLPF